jgi:tetratricopeptide (TPR) repeat protein
MGGSARADEPLLRSAPVLPPGFRKPVVLVHPLVDQRGLKPDGSAAPEPPAWRAFVGALTARDNLNVMPPDRVLSRQANRAGQAAAMQLARQAAARGAEDHRRVRLDMAISELAGAIQAFETLEHDLVDPAEVGAAALLLAQALQEAGRAGEARLAWLRALRIDPRLQLRAGVDSPTAVEALEAARAAIADERPAPPDVFLAPATNLGANTHVVRARVVGDVLEVTVQSAGGLRVDQQRLDDPEAGDRLAARIWACLPFGRAPASRSAPVELHLDAGFHAGVYANSPAVDAFANVGLGINASLQVASHLTLNAGLVVTNSARDRNEDLREDLTAVRFFSGPGFVWRSDRLRLGAALGFEVATLGDVVITRNVACKHFAVEDGLPPNLCDPERNIARTDRAWQVGAALNLSLGVRLVDRFALIAHITGASYIYESVDSGLGLPLGAQLALGYQVF